MPAKTTKPSDAEKVAEYMEQTEHPLKKEIEALRKIIKSADPAIKERIKWNAPSYYAKEDIVTFNLRTNDHVHLVWHHSKIESFSSPVLEGDLKGRRMSYFKNMKQVNENKEEIRSILKKLTL